MNDKNISRADVVVVVLVAAVASLVGVYAGADGNWWPLIVMVGLLAGGAVLVFVGVDELAVSTTRLPRSLEPLPSPGVPVVAEFAPASGQPLQMAAPQTERHVHLPEEPIERAVARWRTVTAPKLGNDHEMNEDAIAISSSGSIIALADGASSAFASAAWAQALTRTFVEVQPDLSGEAGWHSLLTASTQAWTNATEGATEGAAPGGVDWWSDVARDRGSYAALLTVQIDETGSFTAHAVGDCCLFVFDAEDRMQRVFPIESADDFNLTPDLVASIDDQVPNWMSVTGEVEIGETLLLASDGLAQWLLRAEANMVLFRDAAPHERARLLTEMRTNGEMVNDDVAVAWMVR